MWELLSGISIVILCSVHVFFPYIEQSLDKYKKTWVPVVGGVGVGYVFMSLMPKLSDYTLYIVNADYANLGFLQYRIYLFALFGFMVYLALDIWGESESHQAGKLKRTLGLFSCIYAFFIGYLLHEFSRTGILPTLLGTLALGLHFMGTDHVLSTRHPVFFKKVIRWILAGSLIAGWLTGMVAVLPKMMQMSVIAFVSGAILINVMTEELPNKDKRRYLEFLAGVVFFVIIVLLVRSYPKV